MFGWLSHLFRRNSPPPRPRISTAHAKKEEASMLVYSVEIDPPGASDVEKRRLSVVVDGVEERQVDLPATCVKVGGLKFHEGCDVHLTLWDIDRSGNVSPPAVYNFKAKDTIAPPAPGGFGATITGEVPDAPYALHGAEAHDHRDGKDGSGQKIGPPMAPEIPAKPGKKPSKSKDTDGPQKSISPEG